MNLSVLLLALVALHSATAKNTTEVTNPCLQTPDPGLCKAIIPRYFFNTETNSCDQFTWGGCGGVVPFETLEQCETAQCGVMRCDRKPNPGPCRGVNVRYFFNSTSEQCQEFNWGGCDGTVPFQTMGGCRSRCMADPCTLTPRSGPCQGNETKYFYNATTETCESFRYSGCRGIVPFDTRSECRRSCTDLTRSACGDSCRNQRCSMTPETGPCRAAFTRYFFNSDSQECESFIWGGCEGRVPFDTLEDCQDAQCSGSSSSPDMGPGDEEDDGDSIEDLPGPRITSQPQPRTRESTLT